MPGLDVVGRVAVDVVPVLPEFHNKLRDAVLPIADRVGAQAGRAMGERMGETLRTTMAGQGTRLGDNLGRDIARAMQRHISSALPDAVDEGGRRARAAGARQGEETGGAFSRSLKAKLEAAFRAMPKLDIKLSDTGVDAELARVRAKLEQLSNKRIGIDISAADAEAKVKALDAQLVRLGAEHPNIQVRADTATARAALAELRAEIAAVDARDHRIHFQAETGQAQGAILALAIQIAALTAIPAVPILAAGIGAIAAAATAAGAGVGALALVAIPAFKGIGAALQAQTQEQAAATKATGAGAAANVQAAQQALTMANATQALASAHRSAARAIAQANAQVALAERAVADAVRAAADQRRAALDAVATAERSLSDANRAAKQAEDALTQARADAAKQLRDLQNQLADGQLDQRDAALRVKEAEQQLHKVMADPTASQLQRDEAQLTYDQAVQRQKEQAQAYKDLQAEAKKQQKAGVDGNTAVKTAADHLRDAQQNVIDQTKALADAQKNVVKVQTAGARAIADAQRRVADAVTNAADAQVQAADSVASAERGVASARLAAEKSATSATSKSDAYRVALEKLSPAARKLFDAIAGPKGLKAAFSEWSKTLQPDVLPIFVRGIDSAKNTLPSLTPLVLGAADAIKALQDRASAEVKNPFWQGFKTDIQTSAEPAIVGLGVAFGNVLKGMAGVVDAFLPHMDGISSTMQRITKRFADWGSKLKGSPEFERFLQYVKDNSGPLAEFLGHIMGAILDVSQALAPMSQTMYDVVTPMIDALSWIATNMPEVIQLMWGMYAVTRVIALGMPAVAFGIGLYNTVVALASVETWSWAAAIQATGIVPLIELIVVAIVALAVGVYEAYKHVGWFRTAVDATWTAIKVSTLFLWNNVLKPAFDGIWWAIKGMGDIAVWLWEHAIGPAFRFIWEAAKILVTILLVAVILPLYLGFKLLGALVMWVWTHALRPVFAAFGDFAVWVWKTSIRPVFQAIGDKAVWLWKNVLKPTFDLMMLGFGYLGDVAKWLWEKAIRPVFQFIADKADWLWKRALKPVFDVMMDGVHAIADAFRVAKDDIKAAWDKLQDIAKKPIKFIIDHVYNDAIVPLWNKVADITGAKHLAKMNLQGFATGGVMPGYTPGVDNQIIAVGGGEAIMRPEWTRAVGPDYVHAMNAAARSGGIGGVQAAMGGLPAFNTGGIVGDIWGALKNAGSFVADGAKGAADFITNPDKVFDAASGWIKAQMQQFASSDWGKTVTKIPIAMLKNMKDSLFGGSGGNATEGVGRSLMWAKTQAGKPYQWGGAGDPSWDCSGFMSGIEKMILGQNPLGRLFSTFSFQGNHAPAGWVRNLTSPFQIGVTNEGVGHTAGTLAGVNVESRGGRGVIVGSGARGWNDKLFTDHYGFAPARAGATLYDDGGYLQPGASFVHNLTGKPEPVFTSGQWDTLRANIGGSGPTEIHADVRVFVGDREITDIVRTEITTHDAHTASAITTGRWV